MCSASLCLSGIEKLQTFNANCDEIVTRRVRERERYRYRMVICELYNEYLCKENVIEKERERWRDKWVGFLFLQRPIDMINQGGYTTYMYI